jgi:DNA-binding MarR family transcriptional regulator
MSRQLWDRGRRTAWKHYLSATAQLADRLDHELHHHHDLALIDFGILEQLSEAPDDRLRMSDLAAQVLVSRSRLTYRIDRLAEVGFVTREECEDDRRGMWAIVTPAGREAYEAARTSHQASIDAWFFDQMTEEELRVCDTVMRRIAEKLSDDPSAS